MNLTLDHHDARRSRTKSPFLPSMGVLRSWHVTRPVQSATGAAAAWCVSAS